MSSKCAACGKGGNNLKVCTSCEQVSYCNAKCRKAHRSKHKKECRQLAAERHNVETTVINIDIHDITENFSKIEVSDEKLFAQILRQGMNVKFASYPSVDQEQYINHVVESFCVMDV